MTIKSSVPFSAWPALIRRALMPSAIVIATLALLVACARERMAAVQLPGPLTSEENRIIKIARQAVATNDGWVDHVKFDRPQQQLGGWCVMVWRLAAAPGGFRLIAIDDKGAVTWYHHGY